MKPDDPRFSAISRLYGVDGHRKLREARALIIGIGGVGSWTAEALARSGVGHLTLMDMDEICVTNINRQVHAHDLSVGQAKIGAMADRIRLISPGCIVVEDFRFFSEKNADSILETPWTVIVDAIDSIPHKCLLLSQCRRRGMPVVTVGGAGGRRDPTQIQVVDLTRTFHDPLLQRVRKKLRQNFGFPRNTRKKWGIPAVFSPEPVLYPQSDGRVCAVREANSALRLDCEGGYGTVAHVTGAFGFAAASAAVACMLKETDVGTNS
ncbi:MAG: tRNA threonylcarbamoyladenosine dehydratase [Verrucomicrobia bacterium]|nr:tRNA threonylcarbamoyladenosine dehydratase [Verrucomicrobiota bacterium]MCH8513754.1 tRNA threonylcarbamoyladenosine dehydratase [Kiritimatiellia bacterium]